MKVLNEFDVFIAAVRNKGGCYGNGLACPDGGKRS